MLLVEDDQGVREVATLVLEEGGFRVRPAASAEEAIEFIASESEPPCLILSDIVMPGMDGIEFSRWKATQPSLREVPLFLMTGYSGLSERAAPATGWLNKPVDFHRFLDIVRGYCA